VLDIVGGERSVFVFRAGETFSVGSTLIAQREVYVFLDDAFRERPVFFLDG
jgi:hypothetical protein